MFNASKPAAVPPIVRPLHDVLGGGLDPSPELREASGHECVGTRVEGAVQRGPQRAERVGCALVLEERHARTGEVRRILCATEVP